MAGKEVAEKDQFTFESFRSRLDLEAETTTVEGGSLEKFIQEKLASIMNAGTFEEINAAAAGSGLTKSKDCVGRRFEIRDLALRESAEAFRDGGSALQKYTLVEVVDAATGEELVLDGGGDNFVAQLIAMRDRYSFPFTGTILAQRTTNGFDLLYWRFEDPKRKPLF